MSRKNNSEKKVRERDKTPIYVAIIGLIGTFILALVSLLNTRMQLLLPVSLTQTAIAQLSSTLVSNNTVITQPLTATPTQVSQPSPNTAIPTATAIGVRVYVPAYAEWYRTSVLVKAGQRVVISASGIAEGSGSRWGPEGNGAPQDSCEFAPLLETTCGALVARLVGKQFRVGSSTEFIAWSTGTLFLTINVRYHNITSGGFYVTILVQ